MPKEPWKLRSLRRDKGTPAEMHVLLFFTASKVGQRMYREGGQTLMALIKPYHCVNHINDSLSFSELMLPKMLP